MALLLMQNSANNNTNSHFDLNNLGIADDEEELEELGDSYQRVVYDDSSTEAALDEIFANS